MEREPMHVSLCYKYVEVFLCCGGKEILPSAQTMLDVQSNSAVISAFYKDEDRYIIRLYEAKGRNSSLKIKSFKEFSSVAAVDFLGNPVQHDKIYYDKYVIETALKPWEILNIGFIC